MPKKLINQINIYYEIHGDNTKQPLLLIAGLGQDHTIWYPILDSLTAKFQVVLFDNRGSGQTDSPNISYTTKIMAEDVVGLLEFLKLKNVFIVGHSMGGMVAQQLAINYPKLVDKLILYSTYAYMPVRARKLIEFTGKFFELGAIDTALEYILSQTYSDKFLDNKELVDRTLEIMKKNPYPQTPFGFSRQFEACSSHDTRSQLNLIKAPTFIISGERDIFSMKEEAYELRQNITDAKITFLPSTAHIGHLESSENFLKSVHSFLEIKVEEKQQLNFVKEDEFVLPLSNNNTETRELYFTSRTNKRDASELENINSSELENNSGNSEKKTSKKRRLGVTNEDKV